MLGIIHTMLNTCFIENYTTGFDKFSAYVLGKKDGVVKNAKWASRICDIKEVTIKQLSKTFCENITMFISSWDMQRAQ